MSVWKATPLVLLLLVAVSPQSSQAMNGEPAQNAAPASLLDFANPCALNNEKEAVMRARVSFVTRSAKATPRDLGIPLYAEMSEVQRSGVNATYEHAMVGLNALWAMTARRLNIADKEYTTALEEISDGKCVLARLRLQTATAALAPGTPERAAITQR